MSNDTQTDVQAVESGPETAAIPAGAITYRLRAARATPPPAVRESEERRHLFAAALEQFDDYMRAAAAVGPATRPLQLYYAIASAGAAIIAARAGEIHLPARHGLTLQRAADLLEARVVPKSHGMFQAVADACSAAPLAAPAELGALFASLPELAEAVDEHRWPVAARAGPRVSDTPMRYPGFDLVVSLEPFPSSLDAVAAMLEAYPTLAGGQVTGAVGIERVITARGEFGGEHIGGVLFHFDDELPRMSLEAGLDRRVPEYAVQGRRWARPRIGDGPILTPLLTWWALLYALSMLSRYHPVGWTQALAIDESPIAANLEYALEQATAAIPRLVLGAIWDVNIVEISAFGPP